jgi:hypothetical protein
MEASPWWLCRSSLDAPWKNSGISRAENRWEGKFDGFIKYCVEKLKKIKDILETTLDQACAEMPALQNREPESFLPESIKTWHQSELYRKNRAGIIAAALSEKAARYGLETDFRYRQQNLSVYLKVKVGEFDAAIAFICDEKNLRTEPANLEPPDFETPVVKKYIESRFSGTVYPSESVKTGCDGMTVPEWLDRFQAFTSEKMEGFFPVFAGFRQHLENAAALSEKIAVSISSVLGSDWTVENMSKSLKKNDPINIYKKSWVPEWAQQGDLPPVMMQIVPCSPCFDDLYMVFSFFGRQTADSPKLTGAVCGACDYAFGSDGNASIMGLWSKRIDEPHCKHLGF